MKRTIGLAAVLSALTATPAAATEFNFNFSGSGIFGPLTGSGTFAVADAPVSPGSSAYQITGITGLFNGSQITGLLPGFLGANDYYYKSTPFVDASGVSFSTASGKSVNLFNQSSNGQYRVNTAPFDTGFVTASSSQAQAAVPEPTTWAMMIVGLGLVGGVMRKVRRDCASRSDEQAASAIQRRR
jgi:hypothetical protein